jgi:hypothetical protein
VSADLRCYVRERLIEFLRRSYPHALPRRQIDLEGADQDRIVRAAE